MLIDKIMNLYKLFKKILPYRVNKLWLSYQYNVMLLIIDVRCVSVVGDAVRAARALAGGESGSARWPALRSVSHWLQMAL